MPSKNPGNALGFPSLEISPFDNDSSEFYSRTIAHIKDKPTACPKCGVVNELVIKDNGKRDIRDMKTMEGRILTIELHVRKWLCKACGYAFWEQPEEVCGPSDRITYRLGKYIGVRAVLDPFNKLKTELGVSVSKVKECFDDFCEVNKHRLEYTMPKYLGIDEAHLGKWDRFVLTDPENRRLLDITPSNSPEAVIQYFRERAEKYQDLQNVKYTVMDMNGSYYKLIPQIFPSAIIIIDRFHVVKLLNERLGKYRIEIREAEEDEVWNRELFDVRKLITMNYEDIRIKSNLFRTGDKDTIKEYKSDPLFRIERLFKRYPNLEKAYEIKELVRQLYRFTERRDAAEHLLWLEKHVNGLAKEMDTKLFVSAVRTLKKFAPQILNWIGAPMTNGFTEGTNNGIKRVEKDGRGYSFEVLRYKAIFATQIHSFSPPKLNLKTAVWHPGKTMAMMQGVPDFIASLPSDGWTEILKMYEPMKFRFAPQTFIREINPKDPKWL